MVRVHRIPPELADRHVREMEPGEVKRRFLFYVREGLSRSGAELKGKDPLEHVRTNRRAIA
jgi:hypothetical protein